MKLTRWMFASLLGMIAVVSTVVVNSSADAQEPEKNSGNGSNGTHLPPGFEKIWSEPAWEPRPTLSYDQYMIKCMEDRKTYKSTEEAIQKLKENPRDWIAYATSAEQATFKEDWPEAFRSYRQALKLYPANYRVMYSFASFLLSFDRTESGKKEAISMLQVLSKGFFYQETRRARIALRALGYKTPDPEAEFDTDPYTGKKYKRED